MKKKKEYREFLETFCLRLRDHLRKLIAKQVGLLRWRGDEEKVQLKHLLNQAASRAQTVKITSIHLPEHRGRHGEVGQRKR